MREAFTNILDGHITNIGQVNGYNIWKVTIEVTLNRTDKDGVAYTKDAIFRCVTYDFKIGSAMIRDFKKRSYVRITSHDVRPARHWKTETACGVNPEEYVISQITDLREA